MLQVVSGELSVLLVSFQGNFKAFICRFKISGSFQGAFKGSSSFAQMGFQRSVKIDSGGIGMLMKPPGTTLKCLEVPGTHLNFPKIP